MVTMATKALREKLGGIGTKIRTLADKVHGENRRFSAEEDVEWKALNVDFDSLRDQITISERADEVDSLRREADERVPKPDINNTDTRSRRAQRAADVTAEDRALVLQAWVRQMAGHGLKKRHVEAVQKVRANVQRQRQRVLISRNYNHVRGEFLRQMQSLRGQQRALSAINLAAGGATNPSGFMNTLEAALLFYGGMRQVADVWRTDRGNEVPWPTANDTGNESEQVNENKETNTQDVSFGAVMFGAYKQSSKIILVPYELLEDSAFNLEEFLGNICGERLGRGTNRKFTVGTGQGTIKGLIPSCATVAAAGSSAIKFDDMTKLFHAVDPAYRQNGTFMLHDQIILSLRQLVDDQHRPLWVVDPLGRTPDTILGCPYVINNHMASAFASNAKTVAFGDMSKYKIREVGDIRFRWMRERYAEKDQEGIVAFLRCDGGLIDAGTNPVKVLKH